MEYGLCERPRGPWIGTNVKSDGAAHTTRQNCCAESGEYFLCSMDYGVWGMRLGAGEPGEAAGGGIRGFERKDVEGRRAGW